MAGPADNNIKSGGIDVEYVARLARISLSENERILFQGQLESIVGYVNDIAGVDVSSVPPAALAPGASSCGAVPVAGGVAGTGAVAPAGPRGGAGLGTAPGIGPPGVAPSAVSEGSGGSPAVPGPCAVRGPPPSKQSSTISR